MANEVNPGEGTYREPGAEPAVSRPDAEERLAASLPLDERDQPDAELELSYGRTGAGGITLVAVVCAIIIGVVLWGLNSPAPNAQDVARQSSATTNPPGPGTSGAGTPNPLPSNTGKGGKG